MLAESVAGAPSRFPLGATSISGGREDERAEPAARERQARARPATGSEASRVLAPAPFPTRFWVRAHAHANCRCRCPSPVPPPCDSYLIALINIIATAPTHPPCDHISMSTRASTRPPQKVPLCLCTPPPRNGVDDM